MSRKSVYVSARIDLDDIDTEDMIKHLEDYGYVVAKKADAPEVAEELPPDAWKRIYDWLRGKPDIPQDIRGLVCDATGRVL